MGFSEILDNYKRAGQYFINGGYKQIYKIFYRSEQFPFWTVCHLIWACYVVQASAGKKKCGIAQKFSKFVLSLIIAFIPREIFAIISGMTSPVNAKPLQIGMFCAIYFLMEFSPWDLCYKVMKVGYLFIGLIEGINQVRFLIRASIWRSNGLIPKAFDNYMPLVGLLFMVLDQIIFVIYPKKFTGIYSVDSYRYINKRSIMRTLVLFVISHIATHTNPLTKFIGIYKRELVLVIFGFILGSLNSTSVFNTRLLAQKKQPQETEKQKAN